MTPGAPTMTRATPLEWMRKNLLRTPVDVAVTIVAGVVGGFALFRFLRFVLVTGRWEIVRRNLSLFVVVAYDRDELWRPAVALIAMTAMAGLFAGILRRRQQEAGTAEPELSLGPRLADLAMRLWPAILGVLLMLSLTETITPTFVVGGEVFWGGDSTEMMLNYLDNPALFETSEMKRISDMPMGLIRAK